MLATAFTELVGCQVPIQLAGMPQVSVPRLAAAVADAGGLGMITPTHHTVEVLEQLANETSGKFGINFLIPFLDVEAVEAASCRARVVDFHFGEPDARLVTRVHQGGALAGWQVDQRTRPVPLSMQDATLSSRKGSKQVDMSEGNFLC